MKKGENQMLQTYLEGKEAHKGGGGKKKKVGDWEEMGRLVGRGASGGIKEERERQAKRGNGTKEGKTGRLGGGGWGGGGRPAQKRR